MTKRPQLIIPAVILGVVFLAIAIVYWTTDAGSLPSFFPGHEAGSTHIHFKHGLAAAWSRPPVSSSPGSRPGETAPGALGPQHRIARAAVASEG